MFLPTLVPEEVLLDHPERLRALIVEGSNPYLSYSDTARWRQARERLDLLVVIEPAMTETARAADYVLPTPVGYEKWEFANFPKGYPEVYIQVRPPVVPGPIDALPEPEIYARLGEAMNLFGPAPAALHELAAGAGEPEGALRLLAGTQERATTDAIGKQRLLFWTYRTLGAHLPSPALAAIWLQSHLNAMLRMPNVVRALGPDWDGKSPFEVGAEVFRRILDHPEGVEIARIAEDTNLEDHVGFEDGRIRLAPEPMLAEIERALASPPVSDAGFPFVLAAGLRTRWTANTIQRDPGWRKGRGPHCALNLSPGEPEQPTRAVDLGRPYRGLDGQLRTSVTVGPTNGVVLLLPRSGGVAGDSGPGRAAARGRRSGRASRRRRWASAGRQRRASERPSRRWRPRTRRRSPGPTQSTDPAAAARGTRTRPSPAS